MLFNDVGLRHCSKTKAMEAIKEQRPGGELSGLYQVHPSPIAMRKKAFV